MSKACTARSQLGSSRERATAGCSVTGCGLNGVELLNLKRQTRLVGRRCPVMKSLNIGTEREPVPASSNMRENPGEGKDKIYPTIAIHKNGLTWPLTLKATA